MITCIIVEDEPLAQQVLEKYIAQTPTLQLAGKCNNAVEAFKLLLEQPVDVMFLDIEMPFINGIDFLKSLKIPPAVIFTTAYANYAVMSYELQAIDYLLKPITYERFKQSIARIVKPDAVQEPAPPYFYIKVSGKLLKLLYDDILYAESMKDYIKFTTKSGAHVSHMTMKSLKAALPNFFFRVHRSFLVNAHHITAIGKNEVEIGKTKIPVGENYKNNLAGLAGNK
jgi:two-component system LytT family response regulator